MRYEYFRCANANISKLAVGAWPMGNAGYGEITDKDSIEAIHAMVDKGVNIIDTAPDYGTGHSESVVGEALKGLDRSKLFIATKVGNGGCTMRAIRRGTGHALDSRYENVLYECEQSLRRLGTDYIDFYFVHWPDRDTPFSETMEAMRTLKRQGKIRFACVSNFQKDQILECNDMCEINGLQPPYSMVVQRDKELMKWAVSRGIKTFSYGSIGAGILSGAFRTAPEFKPNDPRSFFYPFFKEPYFSQVMKLVNVLDEIGKEVGRPTVQVAINWQTQQDYVSTALNGVRNVQEAIENCGAFEWELTPEQLARIDAAIDEYIDFDGTNPARKLKK